MSSGRRLDRPSPTGRPGDGDPTSATFPAGDSTELAVLMAALPRGGKVAMREVQSACEGRVSRQKASLSLATRSSIPKTTVSTGP